MNPGGKEGEGRSRERMAKNHGRKSFALDRNAAPKGRLTDVANQIGAVRVQRKAVIHHGTHKRSGAAFPHAIVELNDDEPGTTA